MRSISKKFYVIASVLFCAIIMSFVDGVIQPGYAIKSAAKVLLFLIVPLTYFLLHREEMGQFRTLFLPRGRDLLIALGLGALVYGFLMAGYFGLSLLIDISDMVLQLTADGGVSADNFVLVSLYISFVNSFLEEFLFRGFAFITLKKLSSRRFAYVFSALAFAFYHFGMIAGSVNLPIWIAAMAGLFIAGVVLDFLNEKSGNIYVSWLVHMFANFAINTIGFRIFGMI